LFIAFLPTAAIGLALYKIVKTYLLGSPAVVLWALFLGGIALITFEQWYKKHSGALLQSKTEGDNLGEELVSYKQAAAIGLFQALSIVPGVSRSAATIVGGLWLGLSRSAIVEFSFLLAVPTMAAAAGLDLLLNFQAIAGSGGFGALGLGFVVSFGVALWAIRFLLSYVRRHDFVPFGLYRVFVAIVFWFIMI
jgi:undecaprenyl-diphosphatase